MADAPPFSPTFPSDRAPIARKPLRPPLPTPTGSWPVGGDDAVADQPPNHHNAHTIAQRNASAASSTSSPVDSAYSPTRRTSIASQPFAALSVRKHRSGSISLSTSSQDHASPRKHRLSRSISASETGDQPPLPKTEETARSKSFHKSKTESGSWSSRRPNLRMISTTFSRESGRRTSEQVLQSHYGLGMAAQTPTSATASNGIPLGHSPVAIYQHIHETTNKRMATLEYLRKVNEGQVYYFNTVSYSAANLSALPSLVPSRLGRRATSYLLLGTSMAPVLEHCASNPLDYLRALGAIMTEFDQYSQLASGDTGTSFSKGRMGSILKSGMRGVKSRRSSILPESFSEQTSTNGSSTNLSGLGSIADSFALPPVSSMGHDFQYLQLPILPFDPDFGASLATLTDVLIEAYAGLLSLLPTPESCVPGVAEAFAKADKQMKKVMLGGMVTEFGDNTRKEARNEVNGLSKLVLSGLM